MNKFTLPLKSFFTITICFLLFISCKTEPKPKEPVHGLIAEHAMVVSAREEASKIGTDILKKGGNAFDAMVGTEMALAVTYPFAGNLGGGGFMVYRMANGETGALDYREKAPLAATKNMYLDEQGNPVDSLSREGALAVGVPGTIAGIFAAHEKLGSMSIDSILQPVIELAYRGYAITENQQQRLENYAEIFNKVNGKDIMYSGDFGASDTIKNPQLAKTLERIVKNGKSEFYGGETGQKMVDFINAHGGIMTVEDLQVYEAQWRKPIVFDYKGLRIISMSPPSSGGICLAEIMKMIEPYDLASFGHNSQKAIQVITEAERRAYADRSFYLGDPDFVDIPIDSLTSDAYSKRRMAGFSFDKATPSDSIDHGNIPGYESMETTHYSIVDQFGNSLAV
ncbi:MAG: gamma-glutamyltransferase, partial [Leeuwenhoekiella sp.]